MRMEAFERWLRLDRYRSLHERTLARSLYVAELIVCVFTGLIILIDLAAGTTSNIYPELAGFLIGLAMLALTWGGYLTLAGWLLPTALFVVITRQANLKNGIYDQSVLVYPLLIVLAGLFAGRRGIIAFTVLSMAAIGWMGSWQVFGPTPVVFQDTADMNRLAFTLLIIAAAGGMVLIFVNDIMGSLSRLQNSEQDLLTANRELQTVRGSLEQQVAERTRSTEHARQEAEVARDALRAQAWLANGQVLLSAAMRGDPDTRMLGQRVISQVCQYLGAQVGALYVSDGWMLELAGGYAFSVPGEMEHTDGSLPAVPRFKFGEGLIGQAAHDGRLVRLQEVPPEYLMISSGLGRAAPSQLLVAPFSYNNKVVGVIELGSVQPFTAAHLQYLEQVGESIAIAFTTAKARERMDALLDETQRQAAELMSREEELRFINDELQSQADALRTQVK